MNKIENILESPIIYLIDYYENLKAKVDLDFENRKRNFILKDTCKEWVRIIDVLEKCQEKCIKNKLPEHLINEAKEKMAQMNSKNSEELFEIETKLENYLLVGFGLDKKLSFRPKLSLTDFNYHSFD